MTGFDGLARREWTATTGHRTVEGIHVRHAKQDGALKMNPQQGERTEAGWASNGSR